MKQNTQCQLISSCVIVFQGFLVTVCSDDTLYLWTLKQKVPEVVHSLTFKRERYSPCVETQNARFVHFFSSLFCFITSVGCVGKRVQRRTARSLAFVDTASKTT